MSRTVAALYDTRAEAERARSRLIGEMRARSPRIIAKDTAGAVDGLKIARADAESYREGLRRGGHLLVAEVPNGASAERIIELLEQSIGSGADEQPENKWGDEQGVEVKLPDEAAPEPDQETASEPDQETASEPELEPEAGEPAESSPRQAEEIAARPPIEEERIPVAEEELRVGKRKLVRGGARVRSFTRETPAEEQVVLEDEFVEVESRACERHLTDEEIEAAGLFKERLFEVAEMREEPVVTKTAVVREEVIVRKRVKERTETIRDTLRHTEVEVEDLAPPAGDPPTFFRRDS